MAIRVTSSGPILFRQTRIGRDGRQFSMLKFRTMHL
jgi:lipopolysaccharide/colanic/teichoic acid biosynthesis glycosyltransferase